jgi:uncharacterized repeat protein (TIGR02543 family)
MSRRPIFSALALILVFGLAFLGTTRLLHQTLLLPGAQLAQVSAPLTLRVYSSAGDGIIENTVTGSDWAAVHDATTGFEARYAETGRNLAVSGLANSIHIRRGFFPFDTSALPDDAQITSATLGLYLSSPVNTSNNPADDFFVVTSASQASPSQLTTADFGQVGSSELSNRLASANISAGAYNLFTLSNPNIDRASYTLLAVREGHDLLNDPIAQATPAIQNSVGINMSEAGTSQSPYLDITYTSASAPPPPTQTCGNNTREGTEVCDGTDLNSQTCQSQGSFTGGTLTCNSGCTGYVTTQCTTTQNPPPQGGGGNTYYVNPATGCNNGGPGSQAQPWCDLENPAKIQTGLDPGDTVLVRTGNYRSIRLYGSSSGAPGNPVTIKPYPGDRINIVGGVQFAIRFDSDQNGDPSYITFEGPIDITGSEYSFAAGTQTSAGSTGIVLNNCTIHDVQQGPRWFNFHNSSISNCVVRDITVNGVQFRYSSNITVDNVTVMRVNDNRAPANSDADGFHTYGGNNLVISNSSSSDNAEDGFDLNANATLINVKAFNNKGAGLKGWRRLEDSWIDKTITVQNSLFYNNGFYAPDPNDGNPGIKISDGAGLNLYNSVVYGNYDQGVKVNWSTSDGSYQAGRRYLPVVIKNTIIAGTTGGAGLYDGYNCTRDSASLQGSPRCSSVTNLTTGSNNLFFNNSGGNSSGFNAAGNSAPVNLASLLTGDPLFVSAGSGDFHLQSGSPAIDAGTVISGVTGSVSGSAPDIGAYESGFTQTNPPPTQDTTPPAAPSSLSVSSLTPTTLTLTWPAATDNVGVTGYLVKQGNTTLTTTANLTYNVTGLTAGTAYTFTVTAQDAAGNSSTAVTQTATTPAANYTITVSSGTGGSVSPSGTVTKAWGSSQTFTLTATTGYQLATLLIDGVSQPLATTYTLNNLNANHTLTVGWSQQAQVIPPLTTYTLNLTSTTGGSAYPSLTQASYGAGTVLTLTATPNTGYVFSGWSGDLTSTQNPATLTMTANKSVQARFTAQTTTPPPVTPTVTPTIPRPTPPPPTPPKPPYTQPFLNLLGSKPSTPTTPTKPVSTPKLPTGPVKLPSSPGLPTYPEPTPYELDQANQPEGLWDTLLYYLKQLPERTLGFIAQLDEWLKGKGW